MSFLLSLLQIKVEKKRRKESLASKRLASTAIITRLYHFFQRLDFMGWKKNWNYLKLFTKCNLAFENWLNSRYLLATINFEFHLSFGSFMKLLLLLGLLGFVSGSQLNQSVSLEKNVSLLLGTYFPVSHKPIIANDVVYVYTDLYNIIDVVSVIPWLEKCVPRKDLARSL